MGHHYVPTHHPMGMALGSPLGHSFSQLGVNHKSPEGQCLAPLELSPAWHCRPGSAQPWHRVGFLLGVRLLAGNLELHLSPGERTALKSSSFKPD